MSRIVQSLPRKTVSVLFDKKEHQPIKINLTDPAAMSVYNVWNVCLTMSAMFAEQCIQYLISYIFIVDNPARWSYI